MSVHDAFILAEKNEPFDPMLICPACKESLVHPTAVECRSPGTANGHVRIDCKGIHLDPGQPPSGRGVAITLEFFCECGHAFEYELHFHKGSTFVKRRMRVLPNEMERWPTTIWRD